MPVGRAVEAEADTGNNGPILREGLTPPRETQRTCATDGHRDKAGSSSCCCKGILRNYRLVYFADDCMVILGATVHSTRDGFCPGTEVFAREKVS